LQVKNRIKYLVIFVIIISTLVLSLAIYSESSIHKHNYERTLENLENSVIDNYKINLKESVSAAIEYIDIFYRHLKHEYRREVLEEKKKIKETFFIKSKNDLLTYIKNYKNDLLSISTQKPKETPELIEHFKMSNVDIYIYIDKKTLKNKLIKHIKSYFYKVDAKNKRYLWVTEIKNYKGGDNYATRLIHPNLKETEGVFLSTNIKDIKGNKPYEIELDGINRKSEVFFTYYFKELNSNKVSKKLSFGKLYKKLDWIVSTGIPLSNLESLINSKKASFENEYKDHVQRLFVLGVLTILILILLLVYLNNKVSKFIDINLVLEKKLYKNELDKKYQAELEDKEEQYRYLMEATQDGLWDWNLITNEVYLSPRLKEMMGYKDDELPNKYESWYLNTHPDEREEIMLSVQANIDGKTPNYITRHRVKHKSGHWIWIEDKGKTFFNKEGKAYRMIGSHRDITVEENAQEELAKKIEELKKIEDNLNFAQGIYHIGSWEFNAQEKSLYWSKEVFNILNLAPYEAKPTFELFKQYLHPEDKERVVKAFEKSIEDKKIYKISHRFLLRNGKVKYVEEFGENFYDKNGKFIKCVGTLYDVTKATLMESNWNSFFSLSLNLLTLIDFDLILLKTNPAFYDILGYDDEELNSISFKQIVHPKDLEKTLYEFELVRKGKKTINFENRVKHKDGSYKILAWSAVAVIESNVIYCIAQDITELKNKDYILSQQSKMAAMGEMLVNIAHQWRQPLSLISTISTGIKIKKEVDDLSDEEFFNSMDTINNSTQYLSNTIEDFRNFFNKNKEKKKFKVESIINKTLKLVSAQFVNHSIKVVKDIDNVEILALENEFLQVLINILNNARDALISMDKKDKYIFINVYKKNEKSVCISIKDNANGINENIIDKIFEPYFTTKYKAQGTGIGLYMSEEIITKHMYGKIEVNNTSYKYKDKEEIGAQFIITLPLKI